MFPPQWLSVRASIEQIFIYSKENVIINIYQQIIVMQKGERKVKATTARQV